MCTKLDTRVTVDNTDLAENHPEAVNRPGRVVEVDEWFTALRNSNTLSEEELTLTAETVILSLLRGADVFVLYDEPFTLTTKSGHAFQIIGRQVEPGRVTVIE